MEETKFHCLNCKPKTVTITGFTRLRQHLSYMHQKSITETQSQMYRADRQVVAAPKPTSVKISAEELLGFFEQVNDLVEQGVRSHLTIAQDMQSSASNSVGKVIEGSIATEASGGKKPQE